MKRSGARAADILSDYGALPSQIVDLASDDPRVLSYLDLRRPAPGWTEPSVVESQGRPCVHVFDARDDGAEALPQWCWRIAMRGDGAWVGVLEPGRLHVYRVGGGGDDVAPVHVETAQPGEWALPRFLHDATAGESDVPRRRYLASLLQRSAAQLKDLGLSDGDALSLVGRGLFWRFLMDRGLLAGLRADDICPGSASFETCLDTKARAIRTFGWLARTFNGGLLPFETSARTFRPEAFSRVLANIAHGATETGQLRLPTDWSEVNFAYVPVGLLSEVYEAFVREVDPLTARKHSVHYTPSHLVDFVVTQAFEQTDDASRLRVLDPAAGAGVFLVTAFRKLVEREWRSTGSRPKRKRIREILRDQLVGFDVDARALRLAELALYLTALELDPNPKPIGDLTFEVLRDQVLFHLPPPLGSLGPVAERHRGAFDVVVGNPPWNAMEGSLATKAKWVEGSRTLVSERLGTEAAETFDLPDTNADLPFVWRAMEWAKRGGRIALLLHARWLFGLSPRAVRARSDILRATRVTGILNGSALRSTRVWPKVTAPWSILFATNESPPEPRASAFQFISPTLDVQVDSRQARMRIDWNDSQLVAATEVLHDPSALKARFRGDRMAIRALASARRGGVELADYMAELGLELRNGYQVGGKARPMRDARHMVGLPDTKGAGRLGFEVRPQTLPTFSRDHLLHPRAPELFKGPLLVVPKSIPAAPLAARAIRSAGDLAYDATYYGVSLAKLGPDADILARYLQLVMQSSLLTFVQLLTDPLFGVERESTYLESFNRVPVRRMNELAPSQRARIGGLSSRLARGNSAELTREIDHFVFASLSLSNVERDAVFDTLETSHTVHEAKSRAAAPCSAEERARFATTLRASLDDVLSASGLVTTVRARADLAWSPWHVLQVRVASTANAEDVLAPRADFLEAADEGGASLVVVRTSASTWLVGILEAYRYWTVTRARLLASDLISERSRS